MTLDDAADGSEVLANEFRVRDALVGKRLHPPRAAHAAHEEQVVPSRMPLCFERGQPAAGHVVVRDGLVGEHLLLLGRPRLEEAELVVVGNCDYTLARDGRVEGGTDGPCVPWKQLKELD